MSDLSSYGETVCVESLRTEQTLRKNCSTSYVPTCMPPQLIIPNQSQIWGAQMPTRAMPAHRRGTVHTTGSSAYPEDFPTSYFPTAPLGRSGASTPHLNEKLQVVESALEKEDQGDRLFDPERDGLEVPKRPFLLTHAVVIGTAMILVVVVEMACVAKVRINCRLCILCGD